MAKVELGKKADEKEDKVFYPSLYLSDVPKLDDLPDGEFTFIGVGKIVSHTETNRDGEDPHCSCELEVHSIEPQIEGGEKADLGKKLNDMEASKMRGEEEDDDEEYD